MVTESFESMLTGGHPNSLGRTVEVVDIVLAKPKQIKQLYDCYFSDDEIVRLRTSNALKRVCREHPDWLVPYMDGFINEISKIDQASTQWTLANLFEMLDGFMSKQQKSQAQKILKKNLENHTDWIVLNMTMQTLVGWAKSDRRLAKWIIPYLDRLAKDSRKSVAKRAVKYLSILDT